MKRIIFLLAALLPLVAGAQERYRTLRLEPVDAADTLLVGWIDVKAPNAERGLALLNTYANLYEKRARYLAALAEAGIGDNEETANALNEVDAMYESMRKEYQMMLKQEGLDAESRRSLQEALANIDRDKAEARRQMQGTLDGMAAEGRKVVAGAGDPSEFSDERLRLIKNNLQKYLLGGRLWGFSAARDFRNGFAAVARLDKNGDERWGFVNRAGVLAIPCQWDEVFNFNNQRYYKLSVWDDPEDDDDRPWTSVCRGSRIGMIDTTGVARIPLRFGRPSRAQIVFIKTAKGELAAAKDPQSGKWGLIDRSGNWYKQPFSAGELDWDRAKGVFIDADGKEIQL
jgi:hypothetical protein